jgi:HEAT repeat protein
MNNSVKILLACVLLGIATPALAQDDTEQLQQTALEALIMAPPERAMPIVQRVLAGDSSDELKERALFVLSQIDTPEAQTLLIESAKNSSGELQAEAIRMIGIGGNAETMSALTELYASGDANVREAVLEAYLIADDTAAVYNIARNTEDPQEFEEAVEMLAAMGAVEELRSLSDRPGMGDALIDAYMIAGDVESLELLAGDASDPARQVEAIEALGAAGGDEAGPKLLEIYRGTDSPDIREAALDGMMISGNDEVVLELFRETQDPAEKRQLLEMLVMMDSDAVWDIIDQTLEQ